MKISPSSRRLLPWVGAILLSVAVALGIIEATRLSLEQDYKEGLATEVTRRGLEVMAQTMNGNVMGAVAALGLVDQPIKRVARGEIPLDTPVVMESLQAIGQVYEANGVYVVNPDGIIKSSWDTVGVPLTGVDVKFRPYFQIAMQGKQNIYAAIGTTTGLRSLYFAAPLYGEVSAKCSNYRRRGRSPGAGTGRLRIESLVRPGAPAVSPRACFCQHPRGMDRVSGRAMHPGTAQGDPDAQTVRQGFRQRHTQDVALRPDERHRQH